MVIITWDPVQVLSRNGCWHRKPSACSSLFYLLHLLIFWSWVSMLDNLAPYWWSTYMQCVHAHWVVENFELVDSLNPRIVFPLVHYLMIHRAEVLLLRWGRGSNKPPGTRGLDATGFGNSLHGITDLDRAWCCRA